MSGVLTVPAYSAAVDRRSVVISGLEAGEIKAGLVYTLMVRALASGPFVAPDIRLSNRDGTHPVWAGDTMSLTPDVVERRWTFTALEDATADTVLELTVPAGQIEDTGGFLSVEQWFLMAGEYGWNAFDGDGEDAGGARTAYHLYVWDGASGDSASVMNQIGSEVSDRALRDNWRALRRLLWTPGREILLTKRFYDDTGVLRTATAKAQFAGGLVPDVMAGGTRAEFTVDLLLADPFFYGAVPEVLTFMTNTYEPQEVEVLGDYRSRKLFIDWSSKMTSLRLYDSDGLSMTVNNIGYPDTGIASVHWRVDVEKFNVTKTLSSFGSSFEQNWTGHLSHEGTKEFYALDPGPKALYITASLSGPDVPVTITYYPAWL